MSFVPEGYCDFDYALEKVGRTMFAEDWTGQGWLSPINRTRLRLGFFCPSSLEGSPFLGTQFTENKINLAPQREKKAQDEMRQTLVAGRITAYDMQGGWLAIPPGAWADDEVWRIATEGSGRFKVVFRHDDVDRVFAPKGAGGTEVTARAANKRGRPSKTSEAVKEKMREDLAARRLTPADLADMKQEALAEQYGAGRETANKARKDVLLENDGVNFRQRDEFPTE